MRRAGPFAVVAVNETKDIEIENSYNLLRPKALSCDTMPQTECKILCNLFSASRTSIMVAGNARNIC